MSDTGNLYVIAAPSGTGKTTLVKGLVDSLPKVTVSVSHTTRAKRPNEMQAVHYFFIDHDEFEKKIAHGDFLEHATIFDNYYGTCKQWVTDTLAKGIDVILEIDWQGHQQIKRIFPDAIGIFILPPSLEDLRDRLIKRNQDHPEIIEKRLADVKEAVSHFAEFDYIVVNDEFMQALHELKIIIESGRLLKNRQSAKFSSLINDLLNLNISH